MKQNLTTDIGTATFAPAGKTITFAGVTLTLRQVFLVINATRNVILYNPTDPTRGGTMSGNILTLTFDTAAAGHNASDQLMIIVDVPGVPVVGASLPTTSGAIAAGSTGTVGPLDVSKAGNVTFIVKNTVAASPWGGAPVLIFEQSDDSVSWAAVSVVRSDTGLSASTHALGTGAANAELMFDSAMEGVNWVRCRVTTGPTTNGLTIVIQPGGMPFSPNVSLNAAFRPDMVLRQTMDPVSLFQDTFESALDTANAWTAAVVGTGTAPSAATGTLVLAAGTAVGNASYLRSIPTFANGSSAYLLYAGSWRFDPGAVTNNKRAFGFGVFAATPTTAIPVTNGVVFELSDADGSLMAAVYSNSVRTVTLPLSRPADGNYHRYSIYFRTSVAYWEIDGVTVATVPFPSTQVTSLATVALSVNAAGAAPGTSPTMQATVVGVGDTGRNATQLADGAFPWRKAGVSAAGALKTDGSAVTQPVSVTVALPTGANKIGTVDIATAPAVAKGTQGANALPTQDLKDSGRVYCNFGAVGITGSVSEALVTLTPYRDLTAGTATTTFAVTAGKRLRLQLLMLTWRNNTAAAGGVTIHLRLNAGAVAVTSPIHGTLNASTALATVGSGTTTWVDLPDGLELSGTMQLGITQSAVTAVVGFDVNLVGYEY